MLLWSTKRLSAHAVPVRFPPRTRSQKQMMVMKTNAYYHNHRHESWNFDGSFQTRFSLDLVACVVAGSCIFSAMASCAQQEEKKDEDTVLESWSQTLFPKRNKQELVGVGVRTVFWVSTYALALYLPPSCLKKLKDELPAGPEGHPIVTQEFFDNLLLSNEKDVEKTIRIVPAHNTSSGHFVSGLITSIQNRLQTRELRGTETEIQKLKDALQIIDFKKGAQVDFSWTPGNVFRISCNGEEKEKMSSPALCWAFFDVYLGKDTKATNAKEAFVRGFHGPPKK
eukprot:TRINITY_DN1718_c0_g1_i4.p1 TRINITY_DN1718_c0_g1~~TRINITY_DN1718_c0_g1_i4.p1  ORF type:complete len:282 (-),score=37.90 TRINITY_DN1718_c0_g1_i4:22-867(-)